MRTIFLSALIGLAASSAAQPTYYYQPVTTVPVNNPMTPLPVLDYFARRHPGATPYWGTEGRNYVVRYIDPSTRLGHVIHYNRHGGIVRREDEINLKDSPLELQAFYTRNYPNESLRIWSYNEGTVLRYFIRHDSRVIWFDKDGNYIGRKVFGRF